jgi:hypothetical protein
MLPHCGRKPERSTPAALPRALSCSAPVWVLANAFPVPFPFLKRPDIHAYVDEVEVRPLTWLTSNT